MDANAAGDGAKESSIVTTAIQETFSTSTEVSGPMGDAPQKRPLEDGEEPGPKKLAALSNSGVNFSTSATPVTASLGMQGEPNVMSDSMRLPDDLVGLIIGRGGENIMKMQRETGCRIQITQSIPGTKERPCTLSGTPEQIEVCKNMLNEIISRSQAGTLGSNFNLNSSNPITGGMGDHVEKSVEINIPADKCGLVIGKGGETIKALQQRLGCKMLLIQDSTENLGQSKPLRISGSQANIDNAVNAIHQMMAHRDQQIAQQKMDPTMYGDDETKIPVPKAAVGVVIGKGGDMINQIQSNTGTRIQFKPEDPNLPDRICSVTGSKDGVMAAVHRIREIIQNVAERDGIHMGGGRGGGGGGGAMGPGGGMGGFGQWEGPNNMNRSRGGGMGGVSTEQHLVPANKTGLVIGKGGDTIKQINHQSGAHAEIQRNPPPGSDLNYKTFIIKGTPEQIKMCRRLIQEKVDARVGGGMPGGMGAPQLPPPGNYGPPPQQSGYGGLPPANAFAPPQQNSLQAPPQAPAPSFQPQWGNQFQQWNAPAAATPQQNGADPNKAAVDSNAAAWQSYLQLYGQSQVSAAAAATAVPAAAAAAPAQPDYSKQWDEYLKQTGVMHAAAAAATAGDRPIAVASMATAQALQQQVAAAPAVGAPAPAAQPATTQADYSAAWAEYYRHYYQLHGQQYATAAAGQAPTQT